MSKETVPLPRLPASPPLPVSNKVRYFMYFVVFAYYLIDIKVVYETFNTFLNKSYYAITIVIAFKVCFFIIGVHGIYLSNIVLNAAHTVWLTLSAIFVIVYVDSMRRQIPIIGVNILVILISLWFTGLLSRRTNKKMADTKPINLNVESA